VHLDTPAIVCALLAHGEHGAVVRFLTPGNGLVAGYVRGGRSRKLRPVLEPGNSVALSLRARVDTQLAAATVEPTHSRAALATTGTALAALDWLTALTATALAQDVPHPALYQTLDAIIDAIAAGAGPLSLGEGVVRYEHLLLTELGFGLDLSICAATGSTQDLAYVSPKSSQAVSRGAGLPYAARLLPLPGFLVGTADADAAAIADGLKLTGHFLERDVLSGRAAAVLPSRQRLVTRLAAAGQHTV
jgi:DNA repair protein RecO (recombination protein O)